VGSNPTQGVDDCMRLFCVCVCNGLAIGWSLIQGVLLIVLGLRNLSEAKCFVDVLSSKVGATGKRKIFLSTSEDEVQYSVCILNKIQL
jgi:hypothetical protein